MREQLADTPPPIELRLNDMQRELGVLCVTGSDIYRQAFREATAEALDDPDVRSLVGFALDIRPELTTSRAINLHERAVLPSELKRDMSFPRKLRPTTEDMLEVYTRLVETEMYPETYLGNMMRNPISCVADRGKLIKLIAILEGIDYPLRVKEIGASQNHILKKLALSNKPALPYGETTVISHGKPDIAQTKRLMRLLNTLYLPLGYSTGVDLERIDDPATKNWADACSFYLGERLDTSRVDEYALLTDVNPKQVGFFRSDYSDFDAERFAHELPHAQQYDYVVFPTMLYQQTPEQIRNMFETAKKYLDPKGARRLIAIDFIDYLDMNGTINKQDERWTSYNTFAADPFSDDPVFKHYFSCGGPDPGRAKQIKFEPAAQELISANRIRLLHGAPDRPKV